MPIVDILRRNVQLYPNDTALIEINPEIQERREITWREYDLVEPRSSEGYRSEITWSEFDARSNRFANLLIERGITKGKRVAILLMNCLEWLPIYFGVLKTGALAVPFNYRYTEDEIKYCLDLADCDAIIFGVEFIGRMESIRGRIPRVNPVLYCGADCPSFAESYDKLVKKYPDTDPMIPLFPDDDAAIYFSSGTTGFPKAILHTQSSLESACYTENKNHHQTKDDVFLCIPPLYHTGAKMHWFGSFLVGGKAVLLRGVKPRWILKAASEEQVTIVWLLVPWAQDILDAIDSGEVNLDDYKLDRWRLMHIGAQPVPPSLIKRWKKIFPNHDYDTNYGLSESIGPGCVHLGLENIDHVGAIGVPGYGWEARIVDEKGNEEPALTPGELIVRGPGVMKCYYKNPEATAETLKNGWLYTGDMAQRDAEGFIYLVDRKKDVIISGGENIYPVQIEDYMRQNDSIKDVAVIGLPDHRLGEIAAAIVELKPGAVCTEADIMEFCNALPRYKRPRRIILDVVPRNPTGKIEKPRLREKYCGESLVKSQIEG
ncbi:MAG: class I adenylate-forming enzyme family protein [Eubacteriales bacterium]